MIHWFKARAEYQRKLTDLVRMGYMTDDYRLLSNIDLAFERTHYNNNEVVRSNHTLTILSLFLFSLILLIINVQQSSKFITLRHNLVSLC